MINPADLLQIRFTGLLPTLPWWLPILLVGTGLTAYFADYLDRWLTHLVSEWREVPTLIRYAGATGVGIGITSFGLLGFAEVARTTGATSLRWFYVMLLLLFARAVEGGVSVYILRTLYKQFHQVKQQTSESDRSIGSRLARFFDVLWELLRQRLFKWIITILILTGGLILFGILIFTTVVNRVLIAFVITWSVTTGGLALVSTAWTLRRFPDKVSAVQKTGVVCVVVGGEMYNVPSSIEIVTSPLLGGPISTVIPGFVNTLGYFLGGTLVFIQLQTRLLDEFL